MFNRFRLIVLLIVNLALIAACGPSSKPSEPEPSKPAEELAVVNVHPGLAARSGPGLKYPRQKILKFGTSVKVLEKKNDKRESILGLTGGWCRLEAGKLKAWVFCPLLNFGKYPGEGYIVREGEALLKGSEEYDRYKKLGACIRLDGKTLGKFRGGCFGNPCSFCSGRIYKPGGKLILLEETVGGCEVMGKGTWRKTETGLEATYTESVSLYPGDACLPAEAVEAHRAIKKAAAKYGKSGATLNVNTVLTVVEGGLKSDRVSKDPKAIPGKKSFGGSHSSVHIYTGKKKGDRWHCFYPYEKVEYEQN